MEVFEKDFGKLVRFGTDYYEFEHERLEIFLDTDFGCDDRWITSEHNLNGEKMAIKRRFLESMVGEHIEKVEICTGDESGSVTIVGKNGIFNKKTFKHYHNGYYPRDFRYVWYVWPPEAESDESSDESSDSECDSDY